jgi:predicted GTPase
MTECVLIMGAAGRDFHDLNAVYRGRDDATVVTFTRASGQNVAETAERSLERTIENADPELLLAGRPTSWRTVST